MFAVNKKIRIGKRNAKWHAHHFDSMIRMNQVVDVTEWSETSFPIISVNWIRLNLFSGSDWKWRPIRTNKSRKIYSSVNSSVHSGFYRLRKWSSWILRSPAAAAAAAQSSGEPLMLHRMGMHWLCRPWQLCANTPTRGRGRRGRPLDIGWHLPRS